MISGKREYGRKLRFPQRDHKPAIDYPQSQRDLLWVQLSAWAMQARNTLVEKGLLPNALV